MAAQLEASGEEWDGGVDVHRLGGDMADIGGGDDGRWNIGRNVGERGEGTRKGQRREFVFP